MADILEGLRQKFRERCATDAETIRAHLEGRPTQEPLERVVHRIAGAAGMFGAAELGVAAQGLDATYAAGLAPTDDDLRRLLALL